MIQRPDTRIRIQETYLFKCDLPRDPERFVSWRNDFRFELEEFVDAGLRCGRTLHNGSYPSEGSDRPCEHVHVDDEFSNVTGGYISRNYFLPADVNGEQCA